MKRKASPLGEMKTPTYFRDFAKRNELGWDPIRENMVFEAVSFTVSDQKIFKHSSLAQSVERKRCFAPNEANNLADIYGVVIVQFHYIPP